MHAVCAGARHAPLRNEKTSRRSGALSLASDGRAVAAVASDIDALRSALSAVGRFASKLMSAVKIA